MKTNYREIEINKNGTTKMGNEKGKRKISEDKKKKLVESLEKFNLVEIPANAFYALYILAVRFYIKAIKLLNRCKDLM